MPTPTDAPGLTVGWVTLRPPTAATVKGWKLAPPTSSVSLNVSLTVGAAGLGVVGGMGSAQPAVNTAAPNNTQKIRFILSLVYDTVGPKTNPRPTAIAMASAQPRP